MDRGTPQRRALMFVTTVRWEYELIPRYMTRRFVALSDPEEFRQLAAESTATSCYSRSAVSCTRARVPLHAAVLQPQAPATGRPHADRRENFRPSIQPGSRGCRFNRPSSSDLYSIAMSNRNREDACR